MHSIRRPTAASAPRGGQRNRTGASHDTLHHFRELVLTSITSFITPIWPLGTLPPSSQKPTHFSFRCLNCQRPIPRAQIFLVPAPEKMKISSVCALHQFCSSVRAHSYLYFYLSCEPDGFEVLIMSLILVKEVVLMGLRTWKWCWSSRFFPFSFRNTTVNIPNPIPDNSHF